jgi:hypothetical protein
MPHLFEAVSRRTLAQPLQSLVGVPSLQVCLADGYVARRGETFGSCPPTPLNEIGFSEMPCQGFERLEKRPPLPFVGFGLSSLLESVRQAEQALLREVLGCATDNIVDQTVLVLTAEAKHRLLEKLGVVASPGVADKMIGSFESKDVRHVTVRIIAGLDDGLESCIESSHLFNTGSSVRFGGLEVVKHVSDLHGVLSRVPPLDESTSVG